MLDDVETFPGHIACDSESKSEIVVPIIADGKVRPGPLVSPISPAFFPATFTLPVLPLVPSVYAIYS